ncbi:unnamed protein product [Musa acuminata subsp. burmannicoides]
MLQHLTELQAAASPASPKVGLHPQHRLLPKWDCTHSIVGFSQNCKLQLLPVYLTVLQAPASHRTASCSIAGFSQSGTAPAASPASPKTTSCSIAGFSQSCKLQHLTELQFVIHSTTVVPLLL